jgi:hypothetical protein
LVGLSYWSEGEGWASRKKSWTMLLYAVAVAVCECWRLVCCKSWKWELKFASEERGEEGSEETKTNNGEPSLL